MSVAMPVPSAELPVVIVGAGPAGLAAARALKVRGIPYVQIERHLDVGGIWDIDNPGTPMYKTAHFISSRDKSGFLGYPMPDWFADYPSREQILYYTRSFADEYQLRDSIRFGETVLDARQNEVTLEWTVTTDLGIVHASAIICCSGTTWDPRLPEVPGTFNGTIRHSATYKDPGEFAGKKVLVVGLGNSGADIACDAATNAERAFVSTRRGYHFVPKHILGKPADDTEWLPIWGERLLYRLLAPVVIGDVRRWGLPKPDHRLFETHPLINTQLLHYLQHGDVSAKPAIARFDENRVVFADGSEEEIDVVLFATGYDMSIPYVPRDYLSWSGGRPQMYLNAFAQRPGLFGVSFIEVNSSAYTLFDQVAHLIAAHIDDVRARPQSANGFRRMIATERPNLSGGINFVATDRHANYVEVRAYKRELRRVASRMGWPELRAGEARGSTSGATRKSGL